MDGVCALTLSADQHILLSSCLLACDMLRNRVCKSMHPLHATGDKGTRCVTYNLRPCMSSGGVDGWRVCPDPVCRPADTCVKLPASVSHVEGVGQ